MRGIGLGVALLACCLLTHCGDNVRVLVSINLLPTSATAFAPGGTVQFTATGVFNQPPNTATIIVIWSSSDTSVATVNNSGLATCVQSGGPVRITASAAGSSTTTMSSGGVVIGGAAPGSLAGNASLTCL